MTMLGIIGGIAPGSTIQYYRRIIAAYRGSRAGGAYPRILINSIDLNKLLNLASGNRLEELTDFLAREVSVLATAGVSAALFASNTPHLVFEAVQRRSSIPLLSIVEATCAEAESSGYGRVGILGTIFTMQAGFYPEAFAKRGITVIPPTPEEQDFVHSRYLGELIEGVYRPETRSGMLSILERMIRRDRLEAVILAGTELPLLFRSADVAGVPLLDTTDIHVNAGVAHLLSYEHATGGHRPIKGPVLRELDQESGDQPPDRKERMIQ
ncbi:MAG TPA: amino acid racemase [Holophagaceae bacterium]|nr:amino acid racemase [Holophagaceae bacterium]